ncbi:hypothetical protein RJ640_016497 [Escallonia rubra]|uniref:Uncharacterized protein n=1 Tax=Escallonia rubra TaxID=112253 RepID=A0AA88RLE8_9ASTE|nr:hypothetical protein RJ640_016497 [Escallonia rubra]
MVMMHKLEMCMELANLVIEFVFVFFEAVYTVLQQRSESFFVNPGEFIGERSISGKFSSSMKAKLGLCSGAWMKAGSTSPIDELPWFFFPGQFLGDSFSEGLLHTSCVATALHYVCELNDFRLQQRVKACMLLKRVYWGDIDKWEVFVFDDGQSRPVLRGLDEGWINFPR